MSKELRDTGRVEAFSDGVFAFAITLLVLNLKDPALNSVVDGSLLPGLLNQWPALFALITSFATILIMWVNHHNMFTYIRRTDTVLLFLNGLLLFFVVLTPFTTQLIASHVFAQPNDSETAAVVYSGDFLLLGIVWTATAIYCFRNNLVVGARANRRYVVGLLGYVVAFGLSFFNALASVILILGVAGYFVVYANSFGRER